jgi:hypothetical protein
VTVSLLEIWAAARGHAAPLAAESAGYLLLGVADLVVAAPRAVSPEDVELTPEGSVRLRSRSAAPAPSDVERQLRQLLARTLSLSSSVGPGLRRTAERADETGLESLVLELEKALIPVNRGAARRALSRLHRETERARSAGKLERWLQGESAAPVTLAVATAQAPTMAAPRAPEPWQSEPESPEASPALLPRVTPGPAPRSERVPAVPAPELTLTPEPHIAADDSAHTKPEPAVLRSRERSTSTPRFGTIVTAQTLREEEAELTERAPSVVADEAEAELAIDVELAPSDLETLEVDADADAETPTPLRQAPAQVAQPLVDPEPSTMPDVLLAMVTLHAGVEPDEAPTRLREVVTAEVALAGPAPSAIADAPSEARNEARSDEVPLLPFDAPLDAEPVVLPIEPYTLFHSELAEPELHEALTWDPGPVVSSAAQVPFALQIAEPPPELSPLAPAVLPARQSEVSDLVDSFYVSGGAEEHELRSALKEMAGLELTPMPHPLVSER